MSGRQALSMRQPPLVRPKTKPKKTWLGLFLGLTGIAITSATAGALLVASLGLTPSLQRELSPEEAAVFGEDPIAASSALPLPSLARPVNILVLGTKVLATEVSATSTEDTGYYAPVDSFAGLTDTILLVRLNPEAERVTVLSIPRDTQVTLEDQPFTKINSANAYGGAALSALAVQELLEGVPIDRFVRLNIQGVEALVDALGGVTINVPQDMKYQDDSQHLYINLEAGKQHLNGKEVLQFLQFRHDGYGDIGRVQRQQILMRAILEQALTPSVIPRLPRIASAIKDTFDTNLSFEELMALAGFVIHHGQMRTEMLMVPGRFSDPSEFAISYWLPNGDEVAEMMAQHFDLGYSARAFQTLLPEEVKIAIQDGTDDPEVTWALVDRLHGAGYTNVFVDQPWYEPLATTRIVAQKGDLASASVVRQALGFGNVRVESTGNISSDITIQVGQDWFDQHLAEHP